MPRCRARSSRPASGRMVATAVGADAYAVRLGAGGPRFTLTRSELRDGVDQILRWVTIAIVPTAALLFVSQIRATRLLEKAVSGRGRRHRRDGARGVGAADEHRVRGRGRRGSQDATCWCRSCRPSEGLARVDVLLHRQDRHADGGQAVRGRRRAARCRGTVADALAAIAADDPHPNATMSAIRERFPAAPAGWSPTGSVPFSSAGSGAQRRSTGTGRGTSAARTSAPPGRRRRAGAVEDAASAGARVLVLAHAAGADLGAELPAVPAAGRRWSRCATVRPDAAHARGTSRSRGSR